MSFLLMCVTVPDLIDTVENDFGTESIILAALFITFILMTTFTVLNMLIGVLVEEVSAIAIVEKERVDVEQVKTCFELLVKSDAEVTSRAKEQQSEGNLVELSRSQFEALLENVEAIRVLQDIGVDIYGLIDLIDYIFKDEKPISLPTFMDMVMQLRSANRATVRDVVDVRKFLMHQITCLEYRLLSVLVPN